MCTYKAHLIPRDVHETFLAEAETEANNKKMCIFKLFKTWKIFEMYNLLILHGMELFVKLALNRYNIYIYLRLLCVQLSLSQHHLTRTLT